MDGARECEPVYKYLVKRDINISGAYRVHKVHKVQTTQNLKVYSIPLQTTGSQSLVGDRKMGSSVSLHCRSWALQVTADYMHEECGLGEGSCESGGECTGDWNC